MPVEITAGLFVAMLLGLVWVGVKLTGRYWE